MIMHWLEAYLPLCWIFNSKVYCILLLIQLIGNSGVIVLVISTWRLTDLKSLARLLPEFSSTQSYYHY